MSQYPCYQIKSFKYNGSPHRTWVENWKIPQERLAPDHAEAGYHVFINDQTQILESSGESWKSRIPGIVFFKPGHWFNAVALLEPAGVRYYCNMASPPSLYDRTVTYIDYDLDLIVLPDKEVILVDKEEYEEHKALYRYPATVEREVYKAVDELKMRVSKLAAPFHDDIALRYYDEWKNGRKG